MAQMTRARAVIQEIFGPGKKGIRPLVCAVCVAEKILFEERLAVDDILVTKDIYPKVARQLNKDSRSIARQVERLGNQCWDSMDREQKKKYIGKELRDIRAPKDMIFYLAFYVHFGKGFYRVLDEHPRLLFGERDQTEF